MQLSRDAGILCHKSAVLKRVIKNLEMLYDTASSASSLSQTAWLVSNFVQLFFHCLSSIRGKLWWLKKKDWGRPGKIWAYIVR